MLLFIGLRAPLSAQNIIKDDIAFRNGDNLLTGTLVLPANSENVPVILFIGGINQWGDFHRNRDSFISENLEAVFPPAGVGVMYYNPRGLGGSTGKWQRTNFEGFAEDAIQAVEYLKQRREVDASRIGIIGHDEDAWVAQIVAAKIPQDLQFVVSLAGAPFDATRQLINEYLDSYRCEGQDSLSALTKAEQKAMSHENWVSLFPLTKRWRHMKMKQDFDPAATLQEIEIPTLLVFAENDGEVYPSWSMDRLNEIFSNGMPSNFTVKTVPGSNHYFKVVERCFDPEEATTERNYSFRFKEILRDWVFSHI